MRVQRIGGYYMKRILIEDKAEALELYADISQLTMRILFSTLARIVGSYTSTAKDIALITSIHKKTILDL